VSVQEALPQIAFGNTKISVYLDLRAGPPGVW
jgi:hypothetical protein